MKKRLKEAKDITPGDTIKITGYTWEVATVINQGSFVECELWLWARPVKTCVLRFSDPTFPVTVR